MIRIVDVHGMKPNDESVVYCGRASGGWKPSPLGNPYKVGRDGDLARVLAKYRAWLWGRLKARHEATVTALREIHAIEAYEGLVSLGCWCVNKEAAGEGEEACHCDVIAKAVRWLVEKGGEANGGKEAPESVRCDRCLDAGCDGSCSWGEAEDSRLELQAQAESRHQAVGRVEYTSKAGKKAVYDVVRTGTEEILYGVMKGTVRKTVTLRRKDGNLFTVAEKLCRWLTAQPKAARPAPVHPEQAFEDAAYRKAGLWQRHPDEPLNDDVWGYDDE